MPETTENVTPQKSYQQAFQFGEFPRLSRTKLGNDKPTSALIERKKESKTIQILYDSWRTWQQKTLVCGIIERCTQSQVECLKSVLEPLSHRDFLASYNHRYPAEHLQLNIDPKKLGVKIMRVFDSVITSNVSWKGSALKRKKMLLRRLYLQEQWCSSVPHHTYRDTSEFSDRIQAAVYKLLTQQKLPIRTADANPAVGPSAMVRRPANLSANLRRGRSHASSCSDYSPGDESTAQQQWNTAAQQQQEEAQTPRSKSPDHNQEPMHSAEFSRILLGSTHEIQPSESSQQTDAENTVHTAPGLVNEPVNVEPREVLPTIDVTCTSQHIVGQNEEPGETTGNVPTCSPGNDSVPSPAILVSTCSPGVDSATSPAVLVSTCSPGVDSAPSPAVLVSTCSPGVDSATSPAVLVSISVQAADETSTMQTISGAGSIAIEAESTEHSSSSLSTPVTTRVLGSFNRDTEASGTTTVSTSESDPGVSVVCDVRQLDATTAAETTGEQQIADEPADQIPPEPRRNPKKKVTDLIGQGPPSRDIADSCTGDNTDIRGSVAHAVVCKPIQPESIHHQKLMEQRGGRTFVIEQMEGDIIQFMSKAEDPPEDEVILITDGVEPYLPTDDQAIEDDEIVQDISHRATVDDIAEKVAECVLASPFGLALMSATNCENFSRPRLNNLRDRMSDQVFKSILRVFNLQPAEEFSSEDEDEFTPATRDVGASLSDGGFQSVKTAKASSHTFFPLNRKAKAYKWSHRSSQSNERIRRSSKSRTARVYDISMTEADKLKRDRVPSIDSMATYDYLSEEKKYLPGGVCRQTHGSAPDITKPYQQSFKPAMFTGSEHQKQLPDRRTLAHIFKQQLHFVWKTVSQWPTNDIMRLLVDLVSLKSCGGQEVILSMKYAISDRCGHIRLINELPDRVLLKIFSYIHADTLEQCQEVCRRWYFLCSRDEIWIQICQDLGHSYGIKNLCMLVFDSQPDVVIDWQLAYYELARILKLACSSIKVDVHPATSARPDYAEEFLLRQTPARNASPATSFSSRSSVRELEISQRSSCLSRRTALPDEPAPLGRHSPKRKFVKVSRFPAISRLSPTTASERTEDLVPGNDEISVVGSVDKVATLSTSDARKKIKIKGHLSSKGKKARFSRDGVNSQLSDVTSLYSAKSSKYSSRPSSPASSRGGSTRLGQVVTIASKGRISSLEKLAYKKIEIDEALGEIALDVRTGLMPALCMSGGIEKTRKGFEHRGEDGKLVAPDASTKVEQVLQWCSIDSFNPRNPLHKKCYMGLVKPVTQVDKFRGHLDTVLCCAFDKRRVFTGSTDRVVYLWDLRTGTYVQELEGHKGSVRSLQLDSARDILFSASWDTSIIVWDVIKFRIKLSLVGHTGVVSAIRLSKDKLSLASVSFDGTLRIWSTLTYACRAVLQNHSALIHCLWYDGHLAATGSLDTTVQLYAGHLHEMKHVLTLYTRPTLKDVSSVAAIANRTTGWDMKTRETYMANTIQSVLVIKDLVLGGTIHGELYCWSRLSGETIAIFDCHVGPINSLTLWCDRLLSAGGEGMVKEWDLHTMTCVRVLHDHTSPVQQAKADEKLLRIVTVGDDKLVHVWHFDQKIDFKSTFKKPRKSTVQAVVTRNPTKSPDSGMGTSGKESVEPCRF